MLEFFDRIYGEQSGYAHIALFKNGQPKGRRFVEWPKHRNKFRNFEKAALEGDLYFCPVLFSEARVSEGAALGSLVTWADVDHQAAEPPCGLLVASGSPGHLHAYWPSTEPLDVELTERWNYWHVLELNADAGGWDVTQLLRVPGTLNHKSSPPSEVKLLRVSDAKYAPPPELHRLIVPKYRKPDILPKYETLIAERELEPAIAQLIQEDRPADRSDAMFKLACLLFENGYNFGEAYAVLLRADDKWGKFKERADRDRRLEQLIERAYAKVLSLMNIAAPVEAPKSGIKGLPTARTGFKLTGFADLAKDMPPITWLVDHVLKPGGQVMVASQPGVGKTQLSLDLCMRLVLGAESWVGYKIDKSLPQKIMYLSLEMEEPDIHYFTDRMAYTLDDQELVRLNQNLLFHCTIENFKLDLEASHALSSRGPVESALESGAFTGLVIDSLGATTTKGLLDDVAVRNTMDWVKVLRARYGIWVLILAHTRKISRDARRGVLTLDDIFGSQIQQADLDAAFAIIKVEGQEGYIDLYSLKSRFGPDKKPIRLLRSQNLSLEKSTQEVVQPTSSRGSAPELIDDAHDDMDWDSKDE